MATGTETENQPEAAEEEAPEAAPLGDQGTLSGGEMRDAGGGDPEEVVELPTPQEAVQNAARGKVGSADEQAQALQWFMAETPDAATTEVKTKKLNFGTSTDPEWVTWKVRPIALDVLRSIRKKAAASREARRTGVTDEYVVNLNIVVAATVFPNLRQIAAAVAEAGKGPNDPVEVLRARFASKPGYITQLAGQILALSGFNEDDVQDADALEAAGN